MDIGEGEINKSNNHKNRLVLSINENGKIVFFNKECEKIAGYAKNEALDKDILDFLIPEEHRDQWMQILDTVRYDHSISNIELPWLTREGHKVKASWSAAPVGDSDDNIGDIGLVGEITTLENDFNESLSNYSEYDENINENLDDDVNNMVKKRKNNVVLFRFKDKRLVFGKRSNLTKDEEIYSDSDIVESDKIDNSGFENIAYFASSNNLNTSHDKESADESVEFNEIEDSEDSTSVLDKYDPKNLEKNFEKFNKNSQYYKELEEKNKELFEENQSLKADLKSLRLRFTNSQKKIEKLELEHKNLGRKNIDLLRNSVYFIFDVVGGKKKKEEFDNMINQLEERKSALDDIESQLNKDKQEINRGRKEFVEWREKLELLEDEIEKRNNEILKKEEKVRKNLDFFIETESKDSIEKIIESDDEKDEVEYHAILDKIPESAAIIQRGILKQVNDSFIDLLGYNVDMVIEKNLFDFVIPEGFTGIEKYYLKRLKGENVSSYETMFLTKNDDKISVEVSTKPVFFKGEKAEIAVFKKLFDEPGDDGSFDSVSKIKLEEEESGSVVTDESEIDDVNNKVESKDGALSLDAEKDDVESNNVKEGDADSEVVDDSSGAKEGGSEEIVTNADNKSDQSEMVADDTEFKSLETVKETTSNDSDSEEKDDNEDNKSENDADKKKSDDNENYDDIVKKLKLKAG